MQKNVLEKRAVLNFAYNLGDIVKKNSKNWIARYDKDTDAFSFTTEKLPSDARLQYFGNESAFYITKKGEVKGIFIEYFNKNFVKHNKEVNEIRGLFKEAGKEDGGSSLLEIGLTTRVIKGLEEALENSLAERMELSPA
jgi:hypothetical protein